MYSKKFLFRVYIDGVLSAAFMSCSSLKASVATTMVWEGGSLRATKEEGRVTYEPLTLERGKTGNLDLYNMLLNSIDPEKGASGAGAVGAGSEFKAFNIDLIEYNRAQEPIAGNRVNVAKVNEYEVGGWDNNSDDAVTEKLVLEVNWFKPIAV